MNCPNCGAPVEQDAKFCQSCGASMEASRAAAQSIPPSYRPLSPWAYFGYQLLFALPLIGFICLIVFSFSDQNINRRNFARSYWIKWLLTLIVLVIVVALAYAFGVTDQLPQMYEEWMSQLAY